MKKARNKYKGITLLVYLLLIAVNILADTLPINGITTKQISFIYPSLFMPADFTFFIWIFIYILLGFFAIYQLTVVENTGLDVKAFNELRYYFCASSLGNILWIFAWHYNMIDVSLVIMILIFYCLMSIMMLLKTINRTKGDKLFIGLPFELYFGVVIVAFIANTQILLINLNWKRFGLSQEWITVIMLAIGAAVTIIMMLKTRFKVLGLAVIWVYAGILVNHISRDGFDRHYMHIIIAAVICILILLVMEIIMCRKRKIS